MASTDAAVTAESPPLVALNRPFHPALHRRVEAHPAFTLVVAPGGDLAALPADVRARVRGILLHGHVHIDGPFLSLFPSVTVVSNHGVGIDHIDVPGATAAAVAVGNTPGVLTDATADMAWALILATARHVVAGDAISRAPGTTAFDPFWWGKDVAGATLGVVGLGRIGAAIARRGRRGFGMPVLYHNRRPAPDAVVEE